ncbi:LacI family DNA-binding transcriptional regulator [Fulvivirgaceae bacterium BMA10]|uniref:LacI family DNA-binding transcriptional regulator n=1 Tax=Splendidivirga corallicola TaxID=3051826 RepID=A0ABT8KTB9_9BACT|nr:LacI family DNA-binding transcriptional regulator [Fulvivirgaceae bacterium BMA10]
MKRKTQVNIYDVAKELGVSISTVSRALNDNPKISEKTKKRVKKAADKLGFKKNILASGLMTNKTKIIGVIVPYINREFFAQAINSIEMTAFDLGYKVMICQSADSLERERINIDTLISSRVDGIIMSLSLETNDWSHLQRAIDMGIPIVFFDRVCYDIEHSTKIMVDNFSAAYRATSHLIEKGHKRIGHIGGFMKIKIFQERFNGYKKALNDNNIPLDETIVKETHLTKDDCNKAVKDILDLENPPSAVFCANNLTAITAIFYAQSIGMNVPGDLAVIGFSVDPFATLMKPSLTAVEQPSKEMGKLATERLVEELNGLAEEKATIYGKIILDTKLVVRESS